MDWHGGCVEVCDRKFPHQSVLLRSDWPDFCFRAKQTTDSGLDWSTANSHPAPRLYGCDDTT